MPGLKTLNNLYHKKGMSFIDNLMNLYFIVNKSNTGSYFAFTYKDGNKTFYKKTGEISKIDRVISKYYEKAISYITQIPDGVINEDTLYAFDYNPEHETPLTLVYILDLKNNIYSHDKKTLHPYAERFYVNYPPIIYEGYLNNEQKVKVLNYIYDEKNEKDFSDYLLDVLGIEFDDDDKSLIFRFYDNNQTTAYVAKIINPHLKQIQQNIDSKEVPRNDYIYILLIDLINFIESYTISELDRYVYSENSFDENYILLMNKVFKDYIKTNGKKYVDIKFNIPEYMKGDLFDINYDLIQDKTLLKLLKLNDNFKEIYKILLNFFRNQRHSTNEIFNENLLAMFNSLVKKLNSILLTKDLFERYYPSFNEYRSKLSDVNIKHFNDNSSEKEEVNVIIDNFDIINNSHMELAETLYNKNNAPSIFVMIDDNSQFDENIRMELLNSCIINKPYIKIALHSKSDDLKDILDLIKDSYYPIICATNDLHFKKYVSVIDNIKNLYNSNLKIIDIVIKSDNKQILESIKNRDYITYKQDTPECVHPYFFKLDMIMSNS